MAISKRGKWQRKYGIGEQVQPISPDESVALAQSGEEINRGNSDLMPMAPEGVQEVQDTAQKLAAKGGLDDLKTSKADRAQETAKIIGENNPTPLPVKPDGDLESWAQGNLEGQPMALVKDQIKDFIRKNPTQKIPGRGAASTRDGESFDDFRQSRLSAIRGAMQELAENPNAKIGRTTHSQVIKLIKGWVANGTPDDLSVKHSAMEDEFEAPGAVARLYPDENGKWELNNVDLNSKDQLGPGIYLIRHGSTPLNKELYAANKQPDSMDHLAALSQHIQNMDFESARKAANAASKSGDVTDQDIANVIDQSLPSAQQASGLPPAHLAAVMAAAVSPEKRAEYQQVARSVFGQGLGQLNKADRHSLSSHLGRIGFKSQRDDS